MEAETDVFAMTVEDQLALIDGWKRQDPAVLAAVAARPAPAADTARFTPPSAASLALMKFRLPRPVPLRATARH